MRLNLDFNIVLGKWILFSILIIVILYGSYYSLFGLREGFAPGTCPKGCWQHPPGNADANCTRYNVEDGYNNFKITDEQGTSSSVQITPGMYTLDTLATEMQQAIRSSSDFTKFTCISHGPNYKKPEKKVVDPYVNQLEFNLNSNDGDTLTLDFDSDNKYNPHESPLASLFKTKQLVLKGSQPVYTPIDVTPWFPSDLKPTSTCPQVCTWSSYEGEITKNKEYCKYDADCSACEPVICPQGVCPTPPSNPDPPPSSKRRGNNNNGSGDSSGDSSGDGDKIDCSQAKCYEQPKSGSKRNPNDPDAGFCGIEYEDKTGMKFVFACDSDSSASATCKDCNTACKRDPKTKQFMGDCNPYPKPRANGTDSGGSGPMDYNSGYYYYDSDLDDYMNELMRPGQMTPNQMYNFRQSHYGCDSSEFGCCADGFTFKKDAKGENCFGYLPYYNPILFRGGA
jgi:hypothetical protein